MNNKELIKLKEYIYPNGVYSYRRANMQTIQIKFPEIYEAIKDDYHVKLYMILNNINTIPKCKNPNCNNDVKLKSISKGFRKYCSKGCVSEYLKTNKNFKEKISKTKQLKYKNILKNKYPDLNITQDKNNKNYFIISNYCNHGDIRLYSSTFNKLYKNNIILCQQCKDKIIETYIPTNKDINNFKKIFPQFYKKYRYLFNEVWFRRYFPKEYKIIIYWSNNIKNNISLSEKIYLFKEGLKYRPLCKNCKTKNTYFSNSHKQYTHFCDSPACNKSTSSEELNVYNFLKSLNNTTHHKFYIENKEYDILVKDKNLLIEFNGLYWHGENVQRNKTYHFDKWKTAINNGFHLFTIWEDDWDNKKEIIKSMLKYKLHKIDNSISARKCEIKYVSSHESKIFLDENHIQGKCVDSIRIGLYYKNELVSLMTFGKRNISKKTQFELLRFVNKINTIIPGSASKLFSYFIKQYNPNNIITYASLDYSEGNIYEILGFKKIKETGISYSWVKNKQRYHRSNFMKHKLVAQGEDPNKTEDEIMRGKGYYRIYNSGNLLYTYEKN